jgi:hypothetical protein
MLSFVMVSVSSQITQFWVTIAMNCRALVRCINVHFLVGYEWANSLLS